MTSNKNDGRIDDDDDSDHDGENDTSEMLALELTNDINAIIEDNNDSRMRRKQSSFSSFITSSIMSWTTRGSSSSTLSRPLRQRSSSYDNDNGEDDEDVFVINERHNNNNDDNDDNDYSPQESSSDARSLWEPSGNRFRDFLYFVGPGWLVSIAYVDPGNYQADIQAGSTSNYNLLFAIWWSSILSIYVQILCVRLSLYGQCTLAQIQAKDVITAATASSSGSNSTMMRYINWFLAEFSTVITDLPEVIGIAIACHYFFDWPYYVGVLLSLVTTMVFLSFHSIYGDIQYLEYIICIFVAIMSVSLFTEMIYIQPSYSEMLSGWTVGFLNVESSDMFSIAGILGSVVMPHNLYLHTAAISTSKRTQNIKRSAPGVVKSAVYYCSIEPIIPIIISFFVNMAVVAIAAESVYNNSNDTNDDDAAGGSGGGGGDSNAPPGGEEDREVGLTNFCNYFSNIRGGCLLWGIALLAAGQSSAITTTYTGQYVMDGFLNIQLPVAARAIVTRLVAITPCIICSLLFPNSLNEMVNLVNATLGFMLPFAFTPLVKYNCSEHVMGVGNASVGFEKYLLHVFAILVYVINAYTLSAQGGGFFGNFNLHTLPWASTKYIALRSIEIIVHVFYAWWNYNCLFSTSTLQSYDAVEQHHRQQPGGGGRSEQFVIGDDDDDDNDDQLPAIDDDEPHHQEAIDEEEEVQKEDQLQQNQPVLHNVRPIV